MKDVECPYCGFEQEICHDDGYGYDEDEKFHQECHNCDKLFVFTTTIHISHDAEKADCLNGAEHTWELTKTFPVEYAMWRCTQCGEYKPQ